MSGAKSAVGSLLDLLSGPTAKGVTVLLAGGYISLRAHLNYLGISGPSFLGAERYLMESYMFATALAEILVWMALPLLIFLAIRLIAPHRLYQLSVRLCNWIARFAHFFLPLAALMFLIALLMLLLAMPGGSDMIVGILKGGSIPERSPCLYRVAVISATLWFILVSHLQRRPILRRRMFGDLLSADLAHLLVFLITIGYALAVPLIHGREMHPAAYPIAQVKLKDSPKETLCGFVVLHWSDGLMLWRSVNGRGKATSIALDNVSTMDWGPLQDILASLPATRLPGTVPTCSIDFPSDSRAKQVP